MLFMLVNCLYTNCFQRKENPNLQESCKDSKIGSLSFARKWRIQIFKRLTRESIWCLVTWPWASLFMWSERESSCHQRRPSLSLSMTSCLQPLHWWVQFTKSTRMRMASYTSCTLEKTHLAKSISLTWTSLMFQVFEAILLLDTIFLEYFFLLKSLTAGCFMSCCIGAHWFLSSFAEQLLTGFNNTFATYASIHFFLVNLFWNRATWWYLLKCQPFYPSPTSYECPISWDHRP